MAAFTTERLKQLVNYAIQGAGFDKLLELSSLMGIRVLDGVLYLNTTDGTNYLSVSDKVTAEDMDIVVNADLFARLISKITSDTIELYVKDNGLVIEGNGKYTLQIVPDENGSQLSFPDKFPKNTQEFGTITAADVVTITNTVKASLSTITGSVYSNYYVGKVVASTDKAMMGILNRKLFDTPYLFNRNFVDLMALGGTDVTLSKSNDMLLAECKIGETDGEISVCTKIPDNISEFNIGGVEKFGALELTSYCKVFRADLLDLLDRLSLFVSRFDDGAIQLTFTKDSIDISSMTDSGVESVSYIESKNIVPASIKINIDRLRNQLKSYSSNAVDIYYGNEICIKLVDGDMTQIIALIK